MRASIFVVFSSELEGEGNVIVKLSYLNIDEFVRTEDVLDVVSLLVKALHLTR